MLVGKIRRVSPKVAIGVCGEHGGDPQSIEFFEGLGVHYVSVSPFRIPIAKVAAARARLRAIEAGNTRFLSCLLESRSMVVGQHAQKKNTFFVGMGI